MAFALICDFNSLSSHFVLGYIISIASIILQLSPRMALRTSVLSLYRNVFRQARVWEKVDERTAIRQEARTLFRKNINVEDESEIRAHIHEGQTRMDLALHYRIYSARLPHLQKGTQEHTAQDVQRNHKSADYMKSQDLW